MSAIIPSKRLALFVLVVAALVIATNLLRQQEHIDPLAAFSIATSLALANLALAVAGLRTREWLAWGFTFSSAWRSSCSRDSQTRSARLCSWRQVLLATCLRLPETMAGRARSQRKDPPVVAVRRQAQR